MGLTRTSIRVVSNPGYFIAKHVLVILRSTRKEEENWVFTHTIIAARAILEPCKARHNVLCSSYVTSSDKLQIKGTGITALRITAIS
jgi:hypothetical protein